MSLILACNYILRVYDKFQLLLSVELFNPRLPEVFRITLLPEVGYIIPQSKMLLIWLITLHKVLAKLFFTCSLCFRGQGIHFWHFHRAAMFVWPRKSRSTSGSTSDSCVNCGYCFGCMYFCYFVILYVIEVKESIILHFAVSQSYPCSDNLENPGQLPVLQVLEGTDDWVLWIFVISSFLRFRGLTNLIF